MSQHPEFQIIMVRSPHLTQEEIDRRLRQAFDLILNFDVEKAASPSTEFGDLAKDEAEDTPTPEPEQPGVYHDD